MRLIISTIFMTMLLGSTALAEPNSCTTIIEHTDSVDQNPWRTVNDGVMGGLSSGGSVLEKGVLTFAGITNTNGGGFSSIRVQVPPGIMAGAKTLSVTMHRDTRSYSLTLRTNVASYGRRVAFRAPIMDAPEGGWGQGTLQFNSLQASIWGQPVPDAVFDPAEVVELGLIIYDGKDGPFEMQLKKIEACR